MEKKVRCQVCGKEVPRNEAVSARIIGNSLLEAIRKQHPDFDEKGYVSITELNKLRADHVRKLLQQDKGELSLLEKEILDSMMKNELMAQDPDAQDEELTFGERLSDKIAEFGGSWKFIIAFMCFLFGWIIVNTVILVNRPYDPYPFILLNLILSCVAALQAPVIMMSQNRMETKDRLRAKNDYKVNLKAEIEIRQLHEKMDHLIMKQMEHLIEIQQIQIDLLNEISEKSKGK